MSTAIAIATETSATLLISGTFGVGKTVAAVEVRLEEAVGLEETEKRPIPS
jgi:hypothetical protein